MSAENERKFSNTYTILFMMALSLFCALVLSILASALKAPQEQAKKIDRNKAMLQAAKIYNPEGYFQVEENGKYVPARYVDGYLLPSSEKIVASERDILEITEERLVPILVDSEGNTTTFKDAGIDQKKYEEENKKKGYADLHWKLAYIIKKNPDPSSKGSNEPSGYLIPIAGLGLWDYIYGYMALLEDADTVLGISWYEHKETPGLGGVIEEEGWQKQFSGKKIYAVDSSGATNREKSGMGIRVLKGKVAEHFASGDSRALNAVDGIAGATLTGNGVTDAYKDQLSQYRAFLNKVKREKHGAS